ncbi:MAG TPA: SAM-dependent chlorinase/fluorinase [Pyrinomonadaceae bacterium]
MSTGNSADSTGRLGQVKPNLPVITLLTDFGTADYFVGAVKGVILTINRSATIVDITHEIPPQDIESGAFTLLTCYRDFPDGTIHVAVVDPGVGSSRRAIVVRAGSQYFVGPDNGLFSYIYDREPSCQVFHATATEYFRPSPSSTFHGRDVFAPVAAALSKGISPDALGPQITDFVRLTPLSPTRDDTGRLHGRIIHIDHFGNCITNFTHTDLPDSQPFKLAVNGRVIVTLRHFFTDEHGSPDEIFAIWGSAGFLEIAVNRSSAAELLAAKRGDAVIVSV